MFNVDYSLDKDIDNYLNVIWRLKYLKHGRENLSEDQAEGFPVHFIQELKGAGDRSQAKQIVNNYLGSQHPFFFNHIHTGIHKYLQIALNEKEGEIISKLEQIYKAKFPFKEIGVYITTLKIQPYNFKNRWFMVTIFRGKNDHLKTALHELNHFMFYYYFDGLKKELGNEKFESLKEALTVFTNPEEPGYPNQQKLREWLKTQNRPIPEIIELGEWKNYLSS